MKVIVAGSRIINNYNIVKQAIKSSGFKITELVSGCAVGVDQLGEQYAKEHNISIKQFPADWNKYGRSAGMIRNFAMAQYADTAIVVWNGYSPGSRNMIETMKKLKKPCHEEICV